jgi:hypothetical protein
MILNVRCARPAAVRQEQMIMLLTEIRDELRAEKT